MEIIFVVGAILALPVIIISSLVLGFFFGIAVADKKRTGDYLEMHLHEANETNISLLGEIEGR